MKIRNMRVFLFLFLLIMIACPLQAKIEILTDFVGMLVVTSPSGEVSIVEEGQAIPDIQADSYLEVFDGKFTVTTVEADQVYASCLSHDIMIVGGASIELTCGEDTGLVHVLKMTVHLVDPTGKELDLPEGTKYKIQLVGEKAPATAAGDMIGGPGVGGDLGEGPPVDSRNLQSSPGQ